MNFFHVDRYNFFAIFATDLLNKIQCEVFIENQISVSLPYPEFISKKQRISVFCNWLQSFILGLN